MRGENARSPVTVFFGWLMMATGGLIALTTGACTLYMLAGLMNNGSGGYGATGEWIPLTLVFGGLPCLIGIGLFIGGRKLSAPRKTRRTPLVESDDEPTRRP